MEERHQVGMFSSTRTQRIFSVSPERLLITGKNEGEGTSEDCALPVNVTYVVVTEKLCALHAATKNTASVVNNRFIASGFRGTKIEDFGLQGF